MDDLPSDCEPCALPTDLYPLLPDGDGTGRTLPAPLPPGRLVVSDKGAGKPAFWLSDDFPDMWLWPELVAERDNTGFWPLLLGSDDEGRPWATGEVSFENLTSPADHDPEALLRAWWHRDVVPNRSEPGWWPEPSGQVDRTAPFGERWPDGPAPTPPHRYDPDESARLLTGTLLYDCPDLRFGLVAASSGADAVTAIGWQGAANHTKDTAQISAILRDWERRYGVRVVALEKDSLDLSVSAAPSSRDEALRVAAEHYAFCPATMGLGFSDTSLASYADKLIDRWIWTFRWY